MKRPSLITGLQYRRPAQTRGGLGYGIAMKNSSTTGGYADDVIENSFGTEVSFLLSFVLSLKVSFLKGN